MELAGIFNTAIGSSNIGDQIIMDASLHQVTDLLKNTQLIHFSSHDPLLYHSLKLQREVKANILCGTNCLSSHMFLRPAWAVNAFTVFFIKPVIPIGVGWGAYQGDPDVYTKWLLKKGLTKTGVISVRDEYTKSKLATCGINNTLNTGCPTMWNLSEEHCDSIPEQKSAKVIYTLTDYARDIEADAYSIDTLLKNYEQVYIWIQGSRDLQYLQQLLNEKTHLKNSNIKLIPPSLKQYDAFLESNQADYVGTRLHGGIRALQHSKRTLIIGVDNRAKEKEKDFGLPVIYRENIQGLEEQINRHRKTQIRLPVDQINEFKASLKDTFSAGRPPLEYTAV